MEFVRKRIKNLPYKRIQEYFSFITGSTLILANSYFITKYCKYGRICAIGIGSLSGIICADFASGLVHWIADTWGSTDIPFIGTSFLRPFRQHHVDPTSITRHDFIETNASNFMVMIPIEFWMVRIFSKLEDDDEIRQNYNWLFFFYVFGICVSITNQIHKWSHTYYGLSKCVEFLQNCHIILPRNHHRYHHIAPHETYYCITTGWLNYPLEKIQFWSTLEKIVTKITGCKPRSDDIKWTRNKNYE